MLNLTVWRWVKTIAETKCFTCWNWVFWFIKMKQNDSCNFFLISSLPKLACACEMFVLVRDAASLGNFSACSAKQPVAADCWSVPPVRPFFLSPCAGTEAAAIPSAGLADCFCSLLSSSSICLQENNLKISISVSCSLLLSGFAPRTLVCRVLAASRLTLWMQRWCK